MKPFTLAKAVNTYVAKIPTHVDTKNSEKLSSISAREAYARRQLTSSLASTVHGDKQESVSGGL